ncbi:MAG: cysteine hydrolase [Candidatus Abyssobacteria bacterium SURF_17]|uniref:Cysteine hydrolase n=1 Tax=Candidatus Abyssobacteria bacterium SURF_17 TaxID=2093361 RepID=A0A419F8I6_9BACT|nr:MAG: cysteine hydrolase [Candidatus Abyssubacteria bacterium SURF_17]
MARNALIIIDVLVDFIDKNGALYCGPTAEKIVPFIKKEIERTRENGGLVIYLTDAHKPNDKEFELFPKHSVKGTPGAQIIPELRPKRGDVVVPKTRFSGFYGTKLGEILKENKVQHVTVVGVCTSICVMDTVGGLRDRDYAVTVPKKGVADFDQKFHRFALERMRKTYGAKVV